MAATIIDALVITLGLDPRGVDQGIGAAEDRIGSGVRSIMGMLAPLAGAGVLQSPTAYFSGSLHFVDTRGREAPQWDGLGTRWRLLWFSADEELPERLRY